MAGSGGTRGFVVWTSEVCSQIPLKVLVVLLSNFSGFINIHLRRDSDFYCLT